MNSRIRIGKYLSDDSPNWNDLKQEGTLLLLPFNFVLEYALAGSWKTRWDWN
jgi:hypothetical protein